ncbi:5'-deoxyadenosine deaminase [Halolamina salifodinae]|uniref:Cytosine/adenosine deaminase-related metal-dependent hydrolase n=1 Tax=Halolamina salifodinae TaxID=1202767 RepID=A0A8T4GXY8_9EURY|nr:5'-deoxyadenosine deaminase [Halolamina salifodinae]MBP1987859.1 cytosine/adenosine deaminase-related metal-dependent hydrolase [Halolamina salifodinae]
MLLTGTVVVDADTVVEDGAVVVASEERSTSSSRTESGDGDRIEAVGPASDLRERFPAHDHREFDIVAPGLVGAHVHSVQSLGRGVADDAELLDWLFDYVLPMEAGLDAEGMRLAAELGYLECLASGTTTVIDHLSVHHADAAFEAARERGIRARMGKVLMDKESPDGLEEATEQALTDSEALIRRHHDTENGRIQYAVTPRFAVSCTEECLRGARDLADRYDGVRIHTHASENEDEIAAVETETGMRNVHWLDEVGLTGDDVVLAHCVHTDEAEREVLADTDTHVTHCPSSNMKLASGIAPVEDYVSRGINVALGNDGPPCNNTLDAFTEMRQASLLAKVDDRDPTAIAAEMAFEMATLNGADAAGFERVGALREGWKADIVGLTTDNERATPIHDPVSHLVFAAHGDDVQFTMVDGQVRYEDGEHIGVDAAAVRERAQAYAEELFAEI